jgi:hypothetical protein
VVSLPEVEEELRLRGGCLPLMHLFPNAEDYPGVKLPWSEHDKELQEWIKSNEEYQKAVKDSLIPTFTPMTQPPEGDEQGKCQMPAV